jgi:hypothetical protein
MFKPFPPKSAWMEYDFTAFHQPEPAVVKAALGKCAGEMLHAPIKNMGVMGIRTAGQHMRTWPETMDDRTLTAACANAALYIRADAGTGGGLFRWMYARFIREAAQLLNEAELNAAADGLQEAGNRWEKVADLLEALKTCADMRRVSDELATELDELSEIEQHCWEKIAEITGCSVHPKKAGDSGHISSYNSFARNAANLPLSVISVHPVVGSSVR